MANSVLNYIINVVKKGDGDKQTLSSLGTLKSVMTGIGVAAGVATTAYVVLDRTLGEASRKTMKYAEDVRKLSSITNQGAEETSKLIQTMDDFKISADQLTVASKKLASQGLSPTVETMAQLSDEYLNINDGAKRAEFLTKNFGKAGLEMAEAMQAGGDAIRKQSESINKNLILTEKQVQAARKMEIAQDNLNDTWDALSVTVGNKVIPVWSRYLESLNRAIETGNFFKENVDNVIWVLDQLKGRGEMNITTLEEMAIAQRNAYLAAAGLSEELSGVSDEQERLNDLYGAIVSSGSDVADMYGDIGLAALAAGQQMRGVGGKEAAKELLDFQLAMGMITQEVYNTKIELIGVGDELDGLSGREIFFKVTMLKYGFTSLSEAFSVDKPKKEGGGSGDMGGAIGDAIGGWVNSAGWTVVGEHGKELIDPGGYVHSNAESRRLVAMGIAPMRGLAVGGDTEGGGVFNPIVPRPGSLASVIASGTVINTSGRAGSSTPTQTAVSPTALVSQAALTTQSAATIGAAASVSIQQTAQLANQLAQAQMATEALLTSIDRRLGNMPAQIRDSLQQVMQT